MGTTGRLRPIFLAQTASALQALADAKEVEESDAFMRAIPVIDIDTWVTRYHPDMIKEAELRSGINHHTTRRDIAARMAIRAFRTQLR